MRVIGMTMTTSPYTTVVTQHKTYKYQSDHGSVSIRKDNGLYHVFLDDYDNGKQVRADFKTLRGAEINFNWYKEYYLRWVS